MALKCEVCGRSLLPSKIPNLEYCDNAECPEYTLLYREVGLDD